MDRRPYYPTKAAWARARAAELNREARLLPIENSANWRAVKRRSQLARHLRSEAARFERLAVRYRASGE